MNHVSVHRINFLVQAVALSQHLLSSSPLLLLVKMVLSWSFLWREREREQKELQTLSASDLLQRHWAADEHLHASILKKRREWKQNGQQRVYILYKIGFRLLEVLKAGPSRPAHES